MYVPIKNEMAEDRLDFEVRYLNMDNSTAVDVSKVRDINFSGSNYDLNGGDIFQNVNNPTNGQNNYYGMPPGQTPMGHYLSSSLGLESTRSFDHNTGKIRKVARFDELFIGPTDATIEGWDYPTQDQYLRGETVNGVGAAHIFFTQSAEFTGSIIQIDQLDYRTIEASTVSGSFTIN